MLSSLVTLCGLLVLSSLLNLNLKRRQLLVDGDVESNPGPSQNYYKFSHGRPKKIKVFRGTTKEIILLVIMLR